MASIKPSLFTYTIKTYFLFLVGMVLLHSDVIEAKIGFVKDQSMDAVFPGPVYSQDKSLPEGHLRPLGWQRKPDGPVPEEAEMPNTREFSQQYVQPGKPVVFRNGVKEAPAFTSWENDDHLVQSYGSVNVSVRVRVGRRHDKVSTTREVISFKKFLYDYMYDELYLASVIPKALMDELPLPKCTRCGTLAERLLSAHLWMSSGGTSSRLHSHDQHLMHCVLFGRRDFILISGAYKQNFDFVQDYSGSIGGHSDLDMDRINAIKYKSILRTPWTWSTLYPGDCIYVPSGYLHQVRSHGRSVSITLEFLPYKEFDDTGCVLVEDEFVPLSDALYIVGFENGQLRLSNTNLDAEEVRTLLLMLMGRSDVLTQAKFGHFYNMVTDQGTDGPSASRVFDFMTSDEGESQLTRRDVENMASTALLKVADVFNAANKDVRKSKLETEKDTKQKFSEVVHGEL